MKKRENPFHRFVFIDALIFIVIYNINKFPNTLLLKTNLKKEFWYLYVQNHYHITDEFNEENIYDLDS